MSVKTYIADSSGIAREIKKLYIGDANNIAREIKLLYAGDANNKARLIFLKREPVILPAVPSGYTALEYIYNPNSSFIAGLNINIPGNYKTELVFSVISGESKGGYMLGTYSYYHTKSTLGTTVNNYHVMRATFSLSVGTEKATVSASIGGTGSCSYSGGTHATAGTTITLSSSIEFGKHTLIVDPITKTYEIDGVSKAMSGSKTSTTTACMANTVLFAANYSYYEKLSSSGTAKTESSEGKTPSNYRFYRLKAYNKSGVLSYDYVPVRNSAGEVGILDLINNKFFTSYEGDPVLVPGSE